MKKSTLFVVPVFALIISLACGLSIPNFDTPEPSVTPLPTGESQGITHPDDNANLPDAVVVNDEGGPSVVRGEVAYTNYFFTAGVAQPVIILEDQAGFIDRDRDFIMPSASQTIGQITSDFFTSPFTYSLALPVEPQGTLRDVDNDGGPDTGVMVFAVAYWNNIWGDPFLEERDLSGGGWSGAYASTRISEDAQDKGEYVGGQVLVYSPDGNQGFPSGFGEDGKLFTEDDPIVKLPQGYTFVNMDVEPFIFDRSREVVMELYEPSGTAMDDFSDLSYAEAFDAMIDKMRREYAFTEYKGIDWDTLHATYRPQFEEADRRGDTLIYLRALSAVIQSIPDGHVSGGFVVNDFWDQVGGGLGFNLRETSDGRAYVTYVLPNSPAEQAGIQVGAEILQIDGKDVTRAIDGTLPWFGPYSTDHARRLNQMLFAVRFPPGERIAVIYQNPGSGQATATLQAVQETESLFASLSYGELTGFELPVQYTLLDSGYAYVQIFSFLDNDLLSIQLWERLMTNLNENNTPALIIDLRQNSGGSGFLADQMAAYLFNEELTLGSTGYYDEEYGGFYFDPDYEDQFILPPENLRYHGPVMVIFGPDCASACEFFAYDLSLQGRTSSIGHYPTAGLGGSVEVFMMPEGEDIRFTIGRAVDSNGEIHIEGKGVEPDILIPLTYEALFGDQDVLLQAAIDYLDGR
nr:PDZ domain-containing protein [Anaerolineae bacterium]